jgi:quinol monooxygenase YgiN
MNLTEEDHEGERPMVQTTIRMVIPASKHAEVLSVLRAMTEQNRIQPGCLSSYCYRDAEEANVIMIEEVWKSEEDLDRHLRSELYSRMLLIMEMAVVKPEIKFNTISESSGIEMIEAARHSSRSKRLR